MCAPKLNEFEFKFTYKTKLTCPMSDHVLKLLNEFRIDLRSDLNKSNIEKKPEYEGVQI